MSARKKAPVVDAVFLHFVIEDAVGDVDVARGLMNVAAGTGEGLFQPGFLKQAHFLVKAEGRGVRTGQRCMIGIVISRPKASFIFAASLPALCLPEGVIHVTSPSRSGGTMILWTSSGVS